MEHFLRKRLPAGTDDLPVEKYLSAVQQMEQMPQYSTKLGRALPSRALERATPDQQGLGAWTSLGPGNVGGRVRAFLIHPTTPAVMYAAGVAGGVWKTTDGGANWRPIADLIANIAVNSMAMEPGNPNVIYAGTGQGTFAGSAIRGAGIFKTTDGGTSWTRLAETNTLDFHYVNDLAVSPNNPQRVYAATRTGVWLSIDGGATWTKSLATGVQGGVMDLLLRPGGPADNVLASVGSFAQATIFRNIDAAGSGAWDSVLTETGMGRTSLAIAPSNPNVLYALASSIVSGPYQFGLHALFRSTDGGATWEARVRNTNPNKLNTAILSYPAFLSGSLQNGLSCRPETSDFRAQAWLTNVVAVDPVDPNRVWAGGIDLFRSDDGGANWGIASYWYADGLLKPRTGSYAHADQMTIVFHPQYDGAANRTLYVTNDGGIYRTDNARNQTSTAPCDPAGASFAWTPLNNSFAVTQFYHGAPYPDGATYFGGTQDNGTVRGNNNDGPEQWREIHFGDGGYVAVDFRNTNTLYAENTGLSIHKSTDGGATFLPSISGITESRSNFLFISPFAMDPSDPKRLWTGGAFIWRTADGAQTWQPAAAITAGLGLVSAVAVAPTDSNYVLVGMSTGEVLRTTLGLTSGPNTIWPYTSPRAGAFISWVAFDPVNKNTVYATSSTFGGAHVFRSTNGGVNWTSIDGTGAARIPDIPVHAIVIDPANPQRMYVGTDLGVFVSTNGGGAWSVENTGFANVPTESLSLQVIDGQTQLYAFTHGRGAWRVATNTPGCNFTLSASEARFPNTDATGTVNLTSAPGSCAWTAVSNADWITVTSGANGTGNGTIGYSISANNSNVTRAGTITIGGRSFIITQAGCQYTLSQTSRIVDAAGGPGSFTVTVEGTGCAWFAASNANWITIQSGNSGTATGEVKYNVAANAGLFGRNGTINVAGQNYTIYQAGSGGACAATAITAGQPINGSLVSGDCLSPLRGGNRFADRYSFSGTAGQMVAISQSSTAFDTFLYLIGPNGALLAQDDDGGDGTNSRIPADTGFFTLPATGTYLIEATVLGENRSGDYSITLSNAPPACTYALSGATQNFTPAGGAGTISVAAAAGCAWTASSDSNWLTISSGGQGSGNGTIGFNVAANASGSSRTGKITVADQSFTITQQGCSYSIAPASQTFSSAGGTGSIAVTASAGCAWQASKDADWMTITAGSSGTGNGTVNYSVAANPGLASRSATILAAGNSFSVTQSGGNPAPALSAISPTSVVAASGAFTLTVMGSNFINGSVIRWNGNDRATSFVSSMQLTAAIPASDVATAGNAAITVFTTGPGGGQSAAINLQIREAARTPTINFINPNPIAAGGQGATISIDGTDFASTSVVRLEGSDRPTSFISATRLTATLTAADLATARDVRITVFTPDGGLSNVLILTVANPVANVPAASFTGTQLAPDSIVAAFGTKLATGMKVADTTPLPTELEGTTVRVIDTAGAQRLARLFFVSPTQINYLLPAETIAGPATVVIRAGDGSVSVGAIQVQQTTPSLFSASADGRGIAAGVALRVKADNSQSFEAIARYDTQLNRIVAVPVDFGAATDQIYLILYGSGIRYRSSLSAISVSLGGVSQQVLFASGVDGLAGLDQINIGPLPRSLAGRGEVDVSLTVDGRTANTVRVGFK